MNIPFLDLSRKHVLLQNELESVFLKTLKSGQYILGDEVTSFESSFAKYIGVDYCISCGNGTDALEMALQILEVGVGDEVIIPAYGWFSGIMAVKKAGATIVLVDVEADTGNIDLDQCIEKIGKKTRAIIPIHLYGNPVQLEKLKEICSQSGVTIIEDCAQAHGARIGDQRVGGFGDLAIFSFYPTKNLGCIGDAGAITTNNPDYADRLFMLRNYGRSTYSPIELSARNSRMDELQAGILNIKMKYLEQWNAKKREIARRYWEVLDPNSPFPVESVFYQFVIKTNNRSRVMESLDFWGIGSAIHYDFTIASLLNDHQKFPEAGNWSRQAVSLPIYPELSNAEISYICEKLKLMTPLLL